MLNDVERVWRAHIRDAASPVETTGASDYQGLEIKTGDLIEFGITAGVPQPFGMPAETKCVDVVVKEDGQFYAMNVETNGGAFLHRIAGHCKVIGTVHDESSDEILKDIFKLVCISAITGRIFDK